MKNVLESWRRYLAEQAGEEKQSGFPKENMLLDFLGDPQAFFTMSDVGRLGVYPPSTFSTPFGLYCYQLDTKHLLMLKHDSIQSDIDKSQREIKYRVNLDREDQETQNLIRRLEILKKYGLDHESEIKTLPFREDAPLIHFFIADWDRVLDFAQYTSEDFDRDLEILNKKYRKKIGDEEVQAFKDSVADAKEENKKIMNNPVLDLDLEKVFSESPASSRLRNSFNQIVRENYWKFISKIDSRLKYGTIADLVDTTRWYLRRTLEIILRTDDRTRRVPLHKRMDIQNEIMNGIDLVLESYGLQYKPQSGEKRWYGKEFIKPTPPVSDYITVEDAINMVINSPFGGVGNAGAALYAVTYNIAQELKYKIDVSDLNNSDLEDERRRKFASREWARIFSRDLGYGGIVDPGFGILHNNEMAQAVFFPQSKKINIVKIATFKNGTYYSSFIDNNPPLRSADMYGYEPKFKQKSKKVQNLGEDPGYDIDRLDISKGFQTLQQSPLDRSIFGSGVRIPFGENIGKNDKIYKHLLSTKSPWVDLDPHSSLTIINNSEDGSFNGVSVEGHSSLTVEASEKEYFTVIESLRVRKGAVLSGPGVEKISCGRFIISGKIPDTSVIYTSSGRSILTVDTIAEIPEIISRGGYKPSLIIRVLGMTPTVALVRNEEGRDKKTLKLSGVAMPTIEMPGRDFISLEGNYFRLVNMAIEDSPEAIQLMAKTQKSDLDQMYIEFNHDFCKTFYGILIPEEETVRVNGAITFFKLARDESDGLYKVV